MDYDQDKIDDAVLALLGFRAFEEDEEGARAWKSYDWDIMDCLLLRAEFWLSAVRALVRAL
jgi:hypothetical protein